MRRYYCLFQILLAALVFAGMNLALRFGTKNAPPRALLRRFDNAPKVDAVFLGNSLMQAGFDEGAFRGETNTGLQAPFNLGLGATSPVEQLLLLRHAIARGPKVELCAYGFFDFQLMEPPQTPVDGNRMMSYYVEPAVAARYYATSAPERVLFPILGKIPCFTDRFIVWARVEQLRRRIGEVGIARKEENNEFGRVSDFRLLEPKNAKRFRADCADWMRRGAGFSAPVEELFRLASTHARRTVLIEMPMAPHHRDVFYATPEWHAYREYVRRLAAERGVEYVDAHDWVPSNGSFGDGLHMNKEGARIFSRRLAQALSR